MGKEILHVQTRTVPGTEVRFFTQRTGAVGGKSYSPYGGRSLERTVTGTEVLVCYQSQPKNPRREAVAERRAVGPERRRPTGGDF